MYRESRKEAQRWGQSKLRDLRFSLMQTPNKNGLSTDKGIMNSHVNLSPIKLSAKGSVDWNSKANASRSHVRKKWLGGSPDRCKFLTFLGKSCRSSFGWTQVNTSICAFDSETCSFAQLYLESMPSKPLKLQHTHSIGCTIKYRWLISVIAIDIWVFTMLVIFGTNIYQQLLFCLQGCKR